jgi:hypothetical protein
MRSKNFLIAEHDYIIKLRYIPYELFIGGRIAQSVWRLPTGWTIEGSDFESWYGKKFSLLHVVQTCSRAHLAS